MEGFDHEINQEGAKSIVEVFGRSLIPRFRPTDEDGGSFLVEKAEVVLILREFYKKYPEQYSRLFADLNKEAAEKAQKKLEHLRLAPEATRDRTEEAAVLERPTVFDSSTISLEEWVAHEYIKLTLAEDLEEMKKK